MKGHHTPNIRRCKPSSKALFSGRSSVGAAGAFTTPERRHTAGAGRRKLKEAEMFARKIVHALCGVMLLGVLATSATSAMIDLRRTTYFTFSGAVQLPGVALPAGTYIF